jgi:hypothetical protein
MSQELKPGDRIRLRRRFHLRGYQPGARGAVVCELAPGALLPRHYRVAMDRGKPSARTIILAEDKIELDV